jgi:hypothetical protein
MGKPKSITAFLPRVAAIGRQHERIKIASKSEPKSNQDVPLLSNPKSQKDFRKMLGL